VLLNGKSSSKKGTFDENRHISKKEEFNISLTYLKCRGALKRASAWQRRLHDCLEPVWDLLSTLYGYYYM
jgi:hypothetical protein